MGCANAGDTGTGYVRNFARLEPPRVASHDGDRLQSTYKRLHAEANTVMRHNAGRHTTPVTMRVGTIVSQ